MSRLRNQLFIALLRALITVLLSLGMGLPLLLAAGQSFLLTRYVLICLGVGVACAFLNLRRWLLLAALSAAALSQAILFFFGLGFFRQLISLLRALVLLIRNVPLAITLQGDALCAQMAVFLTLFCFTLSGPDLDVVLPITLLAALLSGEWMLGLRSECLYMLPALPALLLIYAYTHSFAETPSVRRAKPSVFALPLAAVLTVLALAFAPPEGTVSPTLSRLADDLRTIRDELFFPHQEKRWRYSLAVDGWMPLNTGDRQQLGGKPAPHDHTLMRVWTNDTVYLRGAVLEDYDGTHWDTSLNTQHAWDSLAFHSLRERLFQTKYPLGITLPEKDVRVEFLISYGAGTLFLPQRLRELRVPDDMSPCFAPSSEVFLIRDLENGESYGARYVSVNASDSGMAALAEQAAQQRDTGRKDAAGRYTAVPDGMEQAAALAAQITAGCESDWQKAVALRNYLQTHYRYSLDVSDPPEGEDFVTYFLFGEEKAGYCTYYASAMTVLSRLAGLPARYIEGYLVRPDRTGISEVTGLNAHAWTEVYLSGLGWVTFDATPSLSGGNGDAPPSGTPDTPTPPPQGSVSTPSPTPTPTPTPTPQADRQPESETTPTPTPALSVTPTPTPAPSPDPSSDQPPASRSRLWPWLLLLLIAVLLAWRIRTTEPLRRSQRLKGGQALQLLWLAILRCAKLLGVPIQSDETQISFAERAGQALNVPLVPVARAVSAMRYGRHTPRRAALNAARDAYAALHKKLNPLQQAWLAAGRIFPRKTAGVPELTDKKEQ